MKIELIYFAVARDCNVLWPIFQDQDPLLIKSNALSRTWSNVTYVTGLNYNNNNITIHNNYQYFSQTPSAPVKNNTYFHSTVLFTLTVIVMYVKHYPNFRHKPLSKNTEKNKLDFFLLFNKEQKVLNWR